MEKLTLERQRYLATAIGELVARHLSQSYKVDLTIAREMGAEAGNVAAQRIALTAKERAVLDVEEA